VSLVPDLHVAVEFAALLFAGLLAGEELTVTLGVRGALTTLDDAHHIAMRQALIYRLRVLVPSIFFLALVPAAASLLLDGSSAGVAARYAGVALLVAWLLVTLFGTIPINAAALTWECAAPPSDWAGRVERWERLNSVRTLTAIAAFAALLVGVALQV
jgi:uncharacterized membrane protein